MPAGKVRVSVDGETGERVASIIKTKLGDIDIWMPNSALDMRISLSTEVPGLCLCPFFLIRIATPPPVDDLLMRDRIRQKDRYSYLAEHCQVDLTTTTAGSDKTDVKEITHEIEVEYRHPKYLFIEMAKWERGEAHRFRELVNVMLNTVRSLARKAQ
jgi:hypothetical protein